MEKRNNLSNSDRELLIKDLSARLPYGVYCKIDGIEEPKKLISIEVDDVDGVLLDFGPNEDGLQIQVYLSEVKPCLRPMSSMTEEEKAYIRRVILPKNTYIDNVGDLATFNSEWTYIPMSSIEEYMDFLLRKHLDYRWHVLRDSAIEAPEGMYCFAEE